MGATSRRPARRRKMRVSTHAPVWGRLSRKGTSPPSKGFQLTPPYGGDLHKKCLEEKPGGFNSRPRMGATINSDLFLESLPVSTHAPVWGRQEDPYDYNSMDGFNSRPRMGATVPPKQKAGYGKVSTHAPVWGRLVVHPATNRPQQFQLTPPYGGDCPLYGGGKGGLPVSTHAPVWGRQHYRALPSGNLRFQLTPPYGGDRDLPTCLR